MAFKSISGEKLLAKSVLLTLMFLSLTACVSSSPSPVVEGEPVASAESLRSYALAKK